MERSDKEIKIVSIICNGTDYSIDKIKFYCQQSDFIISADGALELLDELNITPDYILGDMDSLQNHDLLTKYSHIPQEHFKRDKDYTDSELALMYAKKLGAETIVVLRATGDYFDHSYANVMNLLRNRQDNLDIKLITGNAEIMLIEGNYEFKNLQGRRISLFPLMEIEQLQLAGFKYQYNKQNLTITDYSVSNVIDSKTAAIRFASGLLIAILFDAGYN